MPENIIEKKKTQTKPQDNTIGEALDMVLQAVIMITIFSAILPTMPLAVSAQRYFDNQDYEGHTESEILGVTYEKQHIVRPIPWISIHITNNGPDPVLVWINDDSGTPIPINVFETVTISRVGARERIYAIYYQCVHSGETAVLRMYGQY